jgi:hypothetical protein
MGLVIMTTKPLVLLTLSLILFSSCTPAPTYYAWEGSEVTKGQGGAKENVDGIEVWITGKPSRNHKVIGYIEDKRRGRMNMNALNKSLATVAREKGGDGVVLLSSSSDTVGIYTPPATYNAYTNTINSGFSTAVKEHYTKALVIKYVK